MNSLGINVGSSSIKLVLLKGSRVEWHRIIDHEGDFVTTLREALKKTDLPDSIHVLATGTEGRHLLNMNSVIESICIEEALQALSLDTDAVVTLGGEDFVVYTIGENRRIRTSFSGNKCASGTGEFFKQQLGRMNMKLHEIDGIDQNSRVHPLSTRCSVFMKSDCTHKMNKGEATRDDIVLSLSDVMATKVADFLSRARLTSGRVLLTGGVTRNRYIIRFLQEKLPDLDFIVPPQAPFFEAYGAALLAQRSGSLMPPAEDLFTEYELDFGRLPSLRTVEGKVKYIEPRRGTIDPDGEYILGVDGGSTTTKVALINASTDEIVASHYGRTHGDPIRALKNCLVEIRKQIREQVEERKLSITLAATTGSSREILGVFLETGGVYNEIIAHATGTTYFKKDIDTIFEIGGQDAKYVLLKNGVPIDYAMNEACSAGTGSFLEESAAGDLNILRVEEIGEIALRADRPLKFGEHCSAFINSDIRKAIQLGASREDITAGIVTSIVSNYLNRVVGNRTIGQNIVLQGGVAKNKAVPLAFALFLDKTITIPPDPELLGSFGVGILAKHKHADGLLEKGSFDIDSILKTEIIYEREFICKACENLCPIKVLSVNGHRNMFGGRCNKYANMRRKKSLDENRIFNYIDARNSLMFTECSPDPSELVRRRDFTVGIPRAFSVYTLWPLYSWFFHYLGIDARLTEEICHTGIARTEGTYCFPAEIAHGAVQDAVNRGYDYIFVPHFRDMESYQDDVHANFCPITQALPYYITKAFCDVEEKKFLTPVVSFKYGLENAVAPFVQMGETLGIAEEEIRDAFFRANEKQNDFFRKYKALGIEALERARMFNHPVIAVLGRPYNAFTRDANMGIPLKFTSRGYSVIPFDMLPFEESAIYNNMYWYYGQQDMKASVLLRSIDNVFVTFITNFSCAPDSFMLHFEKWIMGTKPFLILELDSHSADAGVDTRVEAFLDIIEGYRTKISGRDPDRYDNGLRLVNNGVDPIHLIDTKNGNRRIEVFGNPDVKMLLSNMGRLSTELLAASLRNADICAEALPVPDFFTLQIARSYMSGKECVPAQLVLGSALRFLNSDKYSEDEIYMLFVPTTTGPCRTGQYFIFYENLFRDLGYPNVVVITLEADNSYNELGPRFTRNAWWGLAIADYMKDIETSLRTCAVDPATAIAKYDELWQELLDHARDLSGVPATLKKIAGEISRIPLKKSINECPKVLVVGEIYVRRDDFAVDELVRLLSKKGIIAKVSGISEWIHYTDYARKTEIQKLLGLLPWYRKFFSRPMKDLILWKIESMWKHYVEKKIKKALGPTGLIPGAPQDMDSIMALANSTFVTDELQSEICISSGVATTAMMDDYSGVIVISPFACLIGRVLEGILTPWFRERNLPIIAVEVDGNMLPPNIVNKLEIFMLNVLRFRSDPGAAQLVEQTEEETSLSRKIIRA